MGVLGADLENKSVKGKVVETGVLIVGGRIQRCFAALNMTLPEWVFMKLSKNKGGKTKKSSSPPYVFRITNGVGVNRQIAEDFWGVSAGMGR